VMSNAAEFYRLGRMYREERALLHSLMDQAPDGLYFKDLEHRYVRLNAAHARILGIDDPEQAIGRSDDDFLPPAVARTHRELIGQIVRDGKSVVDWVERLDTPDGEPRWLSTSKAPVRDDTQRIYRVLGITRDTTERLQGERQTRLLISIGRAVYLAADFDSALGEAIRMVCEETGWVLGGAWLFDEDRTRLAAGRHSYCRDDRFRAFLAATRSHTFAMGEGLPGQVWATGAPVWISEIGPDSPFRNRELARSVGLHACLGVPIRDTANEVIAVIVFFLEYPRQRDERLVATVTAVSDQLSGSFERKRATDALARERGFLKALIDSMSDGVVACDSRGEITLVNRRGSEILGRTDGAYSPRWLVSERRPADAETGRPLRWDELPLARSLRGERTTSAQLVLNGSDSKRSYVSVIGALIVDEAGQQHGAVAVFRDVTELREVERRLLAAQRLEALGQMTGGIAHDFNNIIQVIGGSLDLMLAEGTDDRTARLAATARAAVERSAELTRKLLSFSRARELASSCVDLCALLEGLVEVLKTAIGPHVLLEYDFDPAVGAAFVDAGELESAILNLATNARDAMPDGGTLRLSAHPARSDVLRRAGLDGPDWVAIEVADTGIGIPHAIRERVFEPYFTTKIEGKGTGLGLSMVYGFVTQSGGHVVMDSVDDKGTTMSLLFPRADAAEALGGVTRS
jgi:PAS domain S-box-containing protein